MDNNVAAPPDPPAVVAGLDQHPIMELKKNCRMEEICERLAKNDPTLTRFTTDGAYFNHGMLGRWRSQPTEQQAQEQTELLLNALEHNTHLEDLILNFQSLQLVSTEYQHKLIHFLKSNLNLNVLRLRIPPEAPRATQCLLQGIKCSAVQQVYIWAPGVLLPRSSSSSVSSTRPPQGGCAGLFQFGSSYCQYQAPKEHGLTTFSTFLANLSSLQSFHISDSVLAPEDMCTLSQGIRKNHSLKHVHLANVTAASGHSITNLLQGVSKHPTIQSLDLVGCDVGDDAWYLLLGENSKLQHLRLQTSSLSLESMRRLMGLLKQPRASLQRLEIVRAPLNTACAALIADMLQHNASLRNLVLQRTQLGSHEGALLAKGLHSNTTLQSLSLLDNHISAGIEFRDLLQSSRSLQHLDLSNNEGGHVEESLLYLFQGLEQNSTLQSLHLSNQTRLFQERLMELFGEKPKSVRPDVVECLSRVLANPSCSLVALNLSYRRLGDANLRELCKGLAQNTSLKRLELQSVGLGNASMEILGKALKESATLEDLDISGNKGLTQEGFQVLANYLTRSNKKGLATFLFQGFREEGSVQMQACATLLGPVLQENYRLTNVSYPETLDPTSRFYLEWNQHGRRLLFHEDNVPMTLWPSILGRVSQDPSILGAFLRCKADLLASVAPSRHLVVDVGDGGRRRKRTELPAATRYHVKQCVASVSP